VGTSGEIVTRLKPLQLEVCHGYTVRKPAEQYERCVDEFRKSRAGALTTSS